jgi:hypothetical protein
MDPPQSELESYLPAIYQNHKKYLAISIPNATRAAFPLVRDNRIESVISAVNKALFIIYTTVKR